MKYFSVILTRVIQHEVLVVADDEHAARAKAECGPIDKVEYKEGVYAVRETEETSTNPTVCVNELNEKEFNTKVYDPDQCCQYCGEPFVSYDGCFYCT